MVQTATAEDDGKAGCIGTVLGQRLRRSLAISPNLDKLLEHEEWSRRSSATAFPGICNSLEAPMGSATTMPAGLPPPPRLSRNVSAKKRSRSSFVGQEMPVFSPSPSSNPYINPPPTAEDLFLLSHDSDRPVSGPSQQSIRFDDRQQNLSSFLRPQCFKTETLAKGEKNPVSSILCMVANSLDHGPFIPEEDFAVRSTRAVEFQATFGAARSTGTLSNNSLDPTAHRMSVEMVNQSSRISLSTSQPMATSPPESPTLECHGVQPPTTTKSVFSRHSSLLKKQLLPNSLPSDMTDVKPATTNFLDEEERADLVRKSRKLARLFGETPNAEAVVTQAGLIPADRKKSEPGAKLSPHHRHDGVNTFSRRYSVPIPIDGIDFSAAVDADGNLGPPRLCSNLPSSPEDGVVQSSSRHQTSSIRPHSPVSFIELSDDDCSMSVASRTSVSSSYSSKTASIDLRRRKRERLAKLYRFLGSQVPINLVLGKNDGSSASLPPHQPIPSDRHGFDNTGNRRSSLLMRRMSSSAIPSASTWSDDVERLKADLDDREKAIIVRRAQKMEKLFGVAPPLTLYYPRSSSAPSSGSATPSATPFSRTHGFPSYPSTALKSSKQKGSRSATPESSKRLLPRGTTSFARFHSAQGSSASTGSDGPSTFYNHFEQSLNSLNDILDREDKASLAELHQALRGDIVTTLPHATVASGSDEGDGATTPTCLSHRSSISSLLPRSERHAACPARTSMISFDSEYSIAIPAATPQPSSFQQRRKRAAKLTHFFGVDYRELFDDVLESIESDMQVGQRDGTLRAEEVEDLLQKLRKLKYKRQTFL